MFSKINLVLACLLTTLPVQVFAAENNESNAGYLEYKEPAISTVSSVSSTFFYILSLILVFIFILFSAYFVSKIIGNRFGTLGKGNTGRNIVGSIPLDQNKRLIFLQLNDSLLVLGVTEQNISLLKEFDEIEDIERIKRELFDENKANNLFDYHSKTLGSLQDKIKPMLRNLPSGKKGEQDR